MPRCKRCDVRFDKSTSYWKHRRKEHSKYPCPNCGKIFGVRKRLAYHLRSCRIDRKNKISKESETIISFSNYKRLPVVTAKELDTEFEIYMSRKFGKKGIFRNEKMCKFCSQTFGMASDFADHIREHYKSIPLDATGVKSKFDFMHFMGLKIRETNDTEITKNTRTAVDEQRNKMADCKVVIIGERCKICGKSFKCITDLDQHNKIHHYQKKRKKIIIVLRIGKEIISRIPLRRRHIERGTKTVHRSNCNRLETRLDERYENLEYSSHSGHEDGDKGSGTVRVNNVSHFHNKSDGDVREEIEVIEGQNSAQSEISSEKERRRAFRLQSEISLMEGNMTRYSPQYARRRENTIEQCELETVDEAENDHDSVKSSYEAKEDDFGMASTGIYDDEFLLDSVQFSEPWKDEFLEDNESWYSKMKLEENDVDSDGESCYCIGGIEPKLTRKERNDWESEHYNNILNEDDETGSCQELSFHQSPPIYKYSCDAKYQVDFSFPPDERSYGIQVKHQDNAETNNNEDDSDHNVNNSCLFGYQSAISINDEGEDLKLNNSRRCENESFSFQELETGKAAGNAITKYQEVLIKEEVMLDDCTCCVNNVYTPSSHLSA